MAHEIGKINTLLRRLVAYAHPRDAEALLQLEQPRYVAIGLGLGDDGDQHADVARPTRTEFHRRRPTGRDHLRDVADALRTDLPFEAIALQHRAEVVCPPEIIDLIIEQIAHRQREHAPVAAVLGVELVGLLLPAHGLVARVLGQQPARRAMTPVILAGPLIDALGVAMITRRADLRTSPP